MKLLILQEYLKKGLNITERALIRSLSLPILNNILIKTEKNFLNLTSTDLELAIKWWSLAKIEKEGEVVVPANLFSSFFKLLPNKQISLEKKDNFLIIECENLKNQIKILSSEDFPIIPQTSKENFIEIESSFFCQGLSQVVDVAAPSQTRPEISGVSLSFQKDCLKITATDSFRLAEKTIFFDKIKNPPEIKEKETSFILPQKTAKEIINIFSETENNLKIYFSPNQILFESQMPQTPHPQIQLTSRLIEGEYPAYQEIIPKKYQTQIILNKNEFLNQIKIAALFSGKINEVKFKIDPRKNGLGIFSQNIDLGEHTSFLNGEVNGEPVEIAFNHRFLVDGLLNIKTNEVIFELNKDDEPAILKPTADASYLYVAMPVMSSSIKNTA